jgi:soluble lytic murein transglycosylase-like protein
VAYRCATVSQCHRALAWQRHDRHVLHQKLAARARTRARYAIRLAAAAFAIPTSEITRVARCESRLDPNALEPTTHASGLLQFLPSTWARTPFAAFSPFDPIANALAAGYVYHRDGASWREWSCG